MSIITDIRKNEHAKLLRQWGEIKNQMNILKQLELQLRNEILANSPYLDREGTHEFTYAGELLKARVPYSRSIIAPVSDKVSHCVENKPFLILSEYRKLSPRDKRCMDRSLLIRDGQPSLSWS